MFVVKRELRFRFFVPRRQFAEAQVVLREIQRGGRDRFAVGFDIGTARFQKRPGAAVADDVGFDDLHIAVTLFPGPGLPEVILVSGFSAGLMEIPQNQMLHMVRQHMESSPVADQPAGAVVDQRRIGPGGVPVEAAIGILAAVNDRTYRTGIGSPAVEGGRVVDGERGPP